MSARFASPTPSENEVDIMGDLFANDFGGFGSDPDGDDNDFDNSSRKRKKTKTAPPPQDDDLDLGAILEGGGFTDASNGPPKKKGVLTGANLEDGDDEAYIALQQAAAFRKTSNLKGASSAKGGGFQAMGLNPTLLRAITRKGFSVPTPIQRKTIPLIMGRRDVVGMARTGSGKTAAFVIPMIQRLRTHSVRVGARALIMSPSRELAMQTLKVVKELGRDTDLKTVLLVGGDSLEEQFGLLASNPDIVIATPGRFLHLKVEMNLDLSSIKYVVFDEADRLFEMGFAAQLTEILHALPLSRQTLLFSATLPSSLVEFARAGLQDPSLVRLDIETKISPKLKSAFFSVKGPEKEGALLHLLHDVIKIPLGLPEAAIKAREENRRYGGNGDNDDDDDSNPRKRKRLNSGYVSSKVAPTEHSTIVFAATKHHVEYLASILSEAGFAVSHVYGSLDQTARKIQVENFRHGRTNIMVVTDLAARGIDIPVLANVVNYDFPPQAKVFVHRVGRTARADQEGSSYSLVQDTDTPYLMDLQLFLGRKMLLGRDGVEQTSTKANSKGQYDLTRDIVVGSLARSSVEPHVEWVTTLLGDVHDIELLRQVASKAQKQYYRTRLSASSQSAKRAREMVRSRGWSQLHPIFGDNEDTDGAGEDGVDGVSVGAAREDLLAKITGYKPQESIFEVHHQNKKAMKSKAAEVMRTMRKRAGPRRSSSGVPVTANDDEEDDGADYEEGAAALANGGDDSNDDDDDDKDDAEDPWEDDDEDEDDGADVLENDDAWAINDGEGANGAGGAGASWVDSSVYMSYTPRTGPSMDVRAVEERVYGVHGRGGDDDGDGGGFHSFTQAARDATMDLTNDDTAKAFGVPTRSKLRWDKKQGKYVARANDDDGSRAQGGKGNGKMIRGESGVKIAASFQSGRFDKWRKANRLGRLPQVGDAERNGLARQVQNPVAGAGPGPGGRGGFNAGPGTGRFMHKKELAPKEADKFRDDYHVQKKRVAEARENRVGRFKDGEGSYREVKGMDDIRKARKVMEQKRLKNARPARDGGRGGSRGGGRSGGGGGGGGRGGGGGGRGGGGRGRGGGRGGGGRGGRGGGRGRD